MSAMSNKYKRYARKAISLRPDANATAEDLAASWFGKVGLGLPGETWPLWNGRPMEAICQINLRDLPFRSLGLEDIEMITLFMDGLPESNSRNGDGWCLRAYPRISLLKPLVCPVMQSDLNPLPLVSTMLEEDYPYDLIVDESLPEDLILPHNTGMKLGGWPTDFMKFDRWELNEDSMLVAASPSSTDFERGSLDSWLEDPARPTYAFQIDSVRECNWSWGDEGTAYFGRGTVPGKQDVWAMNWACY